MRSVCSRTRRNRPQVPTLLEAWGGGDSTGHRSPPNPSHLSACHHSDAPNVPWPKLDSSLPGPPVPPLRWAPPLGPLALQSVPSSRPPCPAAPLSNLLSGPPDLPTLVSVSPCLHSYESPHSADESGTQPGNKGMGLMVLTHHGTQEVPNQCSLSECGGSTPSSCSSSRGG